MVNIGFIDDPYEGREESGFTAITVGVTGSVALQREVTVTITSDVLLTMHAATCKYEYDRYQQVLSVTCIFL